MEKPHGPANLVCACDFRICPGCFVTRQQLTGTHTSISSFSSFISPFTTYTKCRNSLQMTS